MSNLIKIAIITFALSACSESDKGTQSQAPEQTITPIEKVLIHTPEKPENNFDWVVDRFGELRVLRYKVPGFEALPLKQKQLLYFLSQAALSGRDIMWDQNYHLNLTIRRTLEEIVKHYTGDKNSERYKNLLFYAKQVWFANGIHHHYSNSKFTPSFTREDLQELVTNSQNASFPLEPGQTTDQLLASISDAIFNPMIDAKKVNKALGIDKITNSAVNFYRGVTEAEVIAFYKEMKDPNNQTPPSYGLNSQLVKENGKLVERIWKIGGMYSKALEQVVFWLEKAVTVAENEVQKKSLELLIKYYQTGELVDFDDYSIAWVNDSDSDIDVINGFIEVYNDPLAYRGSFESVVSVRDREATKNISAIALEAQWFEDNMPMNDAFKKNKVTGITGKSIIVVMESGDASPSTPIGINLPNANWIRAQHGSKSVSLGNIVHAYSEAKGKSLQEFAWNEAEIKRVEEHSSIASELLVDMHEVIGHASGKINSGVGTPKETLKQYSSTLEEARADLVGLYYVMDPKLVEIGVSPTTDIGKVAFDNYIRNGLIQQLVRIKAGEEIEEDHMRNRQLVAAWVYEKGAKDNVIEKHTQDNKTYVVVNDYKKLRILFGTLLGEIQRIKSEGDYEAAEKLVETYGIKVDQALHKEVLARFMKLDIAPYSGFVNPTLVAVMSNGEIIDVKIEHAESFESQMLNYAENYSFLPNKN